MWSTSLSMDISGIHLQTQRCMQNSCKWTGGHNQPRRIYRPMKNSVRGRTRGKNRSVRRTGPALGGWGTEAGV